MSESCSFCIEPNILHCLNRSLYHKHAEEEDKSGIVVNQILLREKTSSMIKYLEAIFESDTRQYLCQYLKGEPYHQQMQHLQQYYKFRIYVPLFGKSRPTDTILTYYYQKLKHYYNNIKKKLNLTIQPSSNTSITSRYSATQTNLSTKQQMLKDVKQQFEIEKRKKLSSSIANYKSQSKALEQLITYLKLNSQFQQVQTLKTEDCFGEEKMFQQTVLKKKTYKGLDNEPIKFNIKSKLFKKVTQSSSGRKTPIVLQPYKQRPPSRSRSIKVIKPREQASQNFKWSSPFKKTQNQILKQSRTNINNPLGKRHSSMGKLIFGVYTSPLSPYKKKSLSKEKGKSSVTKLRIASNEKHKPRPEDTFKLKDSPLKIQTIRASNQSSKYKTAPNSPSARKAIRPIQVEKGDNILSIRKKRLQILKEKVQRK